MLRLTKLVSARGEPFGTEVEDVAAGQTERRIEPEPELGFALPEEAREIF